MTMNDHEGEGEGFRNDHVVRWTEFFCFWSENGCMNSPFEQLVTCWIFGMVTYLHINMTKKCKNAQKNCAKFGGGFLEWPRGIIGGLAKWPCLITRGGGGSKFPKIWPRGISMPPIRTLQIRMILLKSRIHCYLWIHTQRNTNRQRRKSLTIKIDTYYIRRRETAVFQKLYILSSIWMSGIVSHSGEMSNQNTTWNGSPYIKIP